VSSRVGSAGGAGSAGSAGPRGRRPGAPDTRGQILEAARESFAAKGFRATTIRAVAADAGVDAALVHHYFGTKDDLFVASLEIPIDPRSAIAAVFAPGLEGAGERLLATVVAVWDEPEGRRPLVALVRSSLGDPASTLLQEGLVRVVFTALQDQLGEDAEVRAGLVATQMLGLIVGRYVVGLEPIASMPRERVVTLVGPTLQRYLTGPLD
jgi:AcrR family transcriptional regulator